MPVNIVIRFKPRSLLHVTYRNFASEVFERKDDFIGRVMFSDESTFHLSRKVNTHVVYI